GACHLGIAGDAGYPGCGRFSTGFPVQCGEVGSESPRNPLAGTQLALDNPCGRPSPTPARGAGPRPFGNAPRDAMKFEIGALSVVFGVLGGSLGVLVLSLILTPIGTAAILHVIGQEFIDQRVGLGEALSFALGRFGSLLGTSILYGLLSVVGVLVCCVGQFFV